MSIKKLTSIGLIALSMMTLVACDWDSNDSKSSVQSSQTTTTQEISETKAKEIAFDDAEVSESEVTNLTIILDQENGQSQYDVEFSAKGTDYSYTIDTTSGSIIEKETEVTETTTSSTKISQDEAKKIAFDDAGVTESKVTNLVIEQDVDQAPITFEIDFVYNHQDYSYSINSETGAIVEKSTESVNG